MRFVSFVLGASFLFWLPFEDARILIPIALALMASLLWAFWISFPRRINTVQDIAWQTWIGIMAGLAVTPLTVLLIFFKNGLHSHGVPDFTPAQILFILQGTPFWAAAGLLTGLGSGMGRKARCPNK
jgi:hypothetical protein